jgi:hypothetical protein
VPAANGRRRSGTSANAMPTGSDDASRGRKGRAVHDPLNRPVGACAIASHHRRGATPSALLGEGPRAVLFVEMRFGTGIAYG